MNSVWHLLRSQIHALRWWLLVWTAALAAWDIGRWTYLSEFRETWPAREPAYFTGLLSLSALLTAALVHLHPPARKVAAWRAWPLRPWKLAAAQLLFVLLFLVLLPGAMEAAFLLHPKLDGFMGDGLSRWFSRSLWPLPIALGIAACSTSMKRFLLDALIFTALWVGVTHIMSNRMVVIRSATYWAGEYHSARGYFFYICLLGAVAGWALVLWHRLKPGQMRLVLYLEPLIWLGYLYGKPLWSSLPSVRHAPGAWVEKLPEKTDLSGRAEVRIETGGLRVVRTDGHYQISAPVSIAGMKPEEHAEIMFRGIKLVEPDGTTHTGQTLSSQSPGYGPYSNRLSWNPWKTPAPPEPEVTALFALSDSLLAEMHQKTCRLECEALLVAGESCEIARLPYAAGERFRDALTELRIEFTGTAEEAASQGFALPANSSPVCCLAKLRRFGDGVQNQFPALFLIHKPTGMEMPLSPVGDYIQTSIPVSHSLTISYCTVATEAEWYRTGILARARKFPQEFEFLIRGELPSGRAALRLDIDGVRLVSPAKLSEGPVPDLNRPEEVTLFLADLNRCLEADAQWNPLPLLQKCGPELLPFLTEESRKPGFYALQGCLFRNDLKLLEALFRPDRPEHRLAFFRGYGQPGLFASLSGRYPLAKELLTEGLTWVKEAPEERLTPSWLYEIRSSAPPEMYPAIRRYLERDGARMPWRQWLNLPGLEPPAIEVEPGPVLQNGVPLDFTTEADFRKLPDYSAGSGILEKAIKQGYPWIPRLVSVMLAGVADRTGAAGVLEIWRRYSDCPPGLPDAIEWMWRHEGSLKFNAESKRYELPR